MSQKTLHLVNKMAQRASRALSLGTLEERSSQPCLAIIRGLEQLHLSLPNLRELHECIFFATVGAISVASQSGSSAASDRSLLQLAPHGLEGAAEMGDLVTLCWLSTAGWFDGQ